MIRPGRRAGRGAPLLLLLLLAACGGEETAQDPPDPPSADTATVPEEAPPEAIRIEERTIAFTTPPGDSALSVPWLWETEVHPDSFGVTRRTSAWLFRAGSWESFLREEERGPDTRAPNRIVPIGPSRIIAEEGDVLRNLIYRRGGRELDLGFGSVLAEWTKPEGGGVRLLEGILTLSSTPVRGFILDMDGGRPVEAVDGGDWAFLVGGPTLQFVLETPDRTLPEDVRAWIRLDFRRLDLPDLRVVRTEVRPFEPSRRDVPYAWEILSSEGRPIGRIASTAAHLAVGEGPGPLLPVHAFYEVEGELLLEGRTLPVKGIWRHLQR